MLKKNCILFLLLVLSSEKIISQIRMGVVGGTELTTNTLNNVEIGVINPSIPCFCGVKKIQTKPALLYSAGFTIDYTFSDEFSISAKTLFGKKGWNENVHYSDFNAGNAAVTYDSKDKYRFSYFELPIYFVFSSSLGNEGAVFHAGFGGFINFALQGKYEFHLLHSQNITESSGAITDQAEEDGLYFLKDSSSLIAVNSLQKKLTNYSANFLDIGVSALLSLELENNIHFDLSVFDGLKNILTSGFYPYPRTNRSIGIGLSVGYYFMKK
jgi:hypothetical protein